jgi:hypothetical protein
MTIAEERPVCEFCSEKSVKYRTGDNPPYQFNPSGIPRSYREFLDWLNELIAAGGSVPDYVYGTCRTHEDYVWVDGEPALTATGRSKLNRTEPKGPRLATARARVAATQAMGGCCEGCRQTGVQLLIIPPDGLREELKLTGPSAWFNRVVEDPDIRGKCRLLCGSCHRAPETEPRDFKTEAIAAYGGGCSVCQDADPNTLWIVPEPGIPAPRTSGGRKLGSRDKLAWLARQGFPPGWRVRCPKHAYTP